jgi:ribosomal protein S20
MIQMCVEHFSTRAARIIYLQKSDFVDSMVKAGVIKENQADRELARLLERSLAELGLEVPEVVRSQM